MDPDLGTKETVPSESGFLLSQDPVQPIKVIK